MTTTGRGELAGVTAATAVRGGAAGVVAFLLGYLLTYLTATTVGQRVVASFEPIASAGGRFAPAWKVAGWLFFDAHFVGTRHAARTTNVVALAGVEYLYLVPVVVLLLAGGVVALAARPRTGRDALAAGATVALGYLLLAAFFAVSVGNAAVGPSLLRALVVAGGVLAWVARR